jgi:hypothetical protein
MKMQLYNIFFLSFLLFQLSAGYLTNIQIGIIRKILVNPTSNTTVIVKSKQILAKHYLPWVLKQYKNYIKKKKNLLRKIIYNEKDLLSYAYCGYLHAIKNYNGFSSFTHYAENYITGSMNRGINDLIPLKPINYYRYRMEKKKNPFYYYLPSKMVSYDNYWMFDSVDEKKRNIHIENYTQKVAMINALVNSMSMEYQKIFYYRYDKDTLKIHKPVNVICDLLCFSHETYCKKMRYIMQDIKRQLSTQSSL